MAQQNRGLRPSERPLERLIAAIVLAAVAALVIGWLALVISRAGVSPPVLFPVAIGAAVGVCQALIFRRLNLSPPLVAAAALGLLLGLLAVAAEDYEGAMAALAEIRPAVDAFFDKVTVNDADPAQRANRLKLLNQLRQATRAVADFDRIAG